jgi:hypothetical protein
VAFAQPEATISGKITDAITHQPLAGARVEYCCLHRVFVVSGSDGAYLLKVVTDDGGGVLTVTKSGYGRVESARLKPGLSEQTRDIELRPAAHIIGRLLDRDTDKPLAGFTVTAMPASGANGAPSFGEPSGADGTFAIDADLNPGDYMLEFRTPSRSNLTFGKVAQGAVPVEYGYGRSWYPGVPREDSASPVTVVPGETRDVEARLRKRELRRIDGVIEVPEGRENERISLSVGIGRGERIADGVNLPVGPFRITGLDDGSYALFATTGTGLSLNQTVDVGDRDIDGLRLTLRNDVSIRAVVRMAEEDAAAPQGIEFIAVPTILGEYVAAPSDTLYQEGMPPGRYWPVLITPPGCAVLETTYGERPVVNAPIDVESAEATVKFVVTSRPASLAGAVRDGDQKPVPGVRVTLLPEGVTDLLDPGARRRLTTTSGPNGTYRIGDLPPGRYRVSTPGFEQAVELDFGRNVSLDLRAP